METILWSEEAGIQIFEGLGVGLWALGFRVLGLAAKGIWVLPQRR